MTNQNNLKITYEDDSITKPILFKLRLNSKRPIDCFKSVLTSKKDLDLSIHNVGFRTGQITNTTVIDLDLYHHGLTIPFVEQFTNSYIDTFNTLTQSTPRGGIHLIFQYDGDLPQTTSNGIDIRSDGGYIVFCPSNIDGKPYEIINNTSIKTIPSDLKQWLLKNLFDNKKPTPKTNVIKSNVFSSIQSPIKYLKIPEDVLKKELNKLPEKYINNYSDWWKFTSLMKHLDQKNLWEDMSKTGKGFSKVNNNKIWNNMKTNNSFSWNILKQDCKSNILDIIQFKEYYETLPKPDVIVDSQYLTKDIINLNTSLIIKSDTGTGKTTLFKQYIKDTNQKFISIGSRMALVNEQERIFKDYGINVLHYKEIKNHGYVQDNISIVTTIDSIRLLNEIDDFSNYVLFLDEFNSLIEYIFMADKCMNNKRLSVLITLIHIMKNCKQIIATDADISNICFTLLNYIGLDYKYIFNEHKHNTDVKMEELISIDEIVEKVKACLKNEENYLICCDTLKYANYIYVAIGKEGTLYTSANKEIIVISNEKQLIISPKLIYGNDSTIGRTVFCIYTGSTITPSNMVQQINRERKIKEVYLYFEGRRYNTPVYIDKQDCIEYSKLIKTKGIKEYGMIDPKLSDMFAEIYCELLYRYDCYDTNKYCHLLNLLDKRGFSVIPFYEKNLKPKTKVVKAVVNQFRSDNFNPDDYKELTKILKLKDDDLMKYKDFYTDSYKLTHHFNLSAYLFQTIDNDTLLDKLDKIDDFPIKKLKQDKNKMIVLRKFEDETEFDLQTVNCNKPMTAKLSKKWNNEIRAVFGFNRKDIDFTDPKSCVKQVYDCYHQLFGYEVLTSKKKKIKGTQKNETVYQTLPLTQHRTLFEFRKFTKEDSICLID